MTKESKRILWSYVNIAWAICSVVALILLWKYNGNYASDLIDKVESNDERLGLGIGTALLIVFQLFGIIAAGVFGLWQAITAIVARVDSQKKSSNLRGCLISAGIEKILGAVVMIYLFLLSQAPLTRVLLIVFALLYIAGAVADFIYRKGANI